MTTDNNEMMPLLPFVSKEQILAFDPARPETYTESRVLNAVLLMSEKSGGHSAEKIAKLLGVEERKLRGALEIVTGYNTRGVLHLRYVDKIITLKKTRPNLSADEVARAIGYADHTSLYRKLGRKMYYDLFG